MADRRRTDPDMHLGGALGAQKLHYLSHGCAPNNGIINEYHTLAPNHPPDRIEFDPDIKFALVLMRGYECTPDIVVAYQADFIAQTPKKRL